MGKKFLIYSFPSSVAKGMMDGDFLLKISAFYVGQVYAYSCIAWLYMYSHISMVKHDARMENMSSFAFQNAYCTVCT